ncbi:MAG: SRPBCC family protein, partial [Chloroflexota bacterium]
MIDIVREIETVQREVGSGRIPAGEGRSVRLRRTYDAPIDEVWDALTNPERIGRWFLPISGDYRIGGRFQFEGNAGGEIVACERPERLLVTWGMGEAGAGDSEVEIRLARAGEDATTLELEHTAVVPEEMWDQYGPGAVGVGWEGGMLGLALHLRGGSIEDPIAWQVSAEGRDYMTRSSEAWGKAYRTAGADVDT